MSTVSGFTVVVSLIDEQVVSRQKCYSWQVYTESSGRPGSYEIFNIFLRNSKSWAWKAEFIPSSGQSGLVERTVAAFSLSYCTDFVLGCNLEWDRFLFWFHQSFFWSCKLLLWRPQTLTCSSLNFIPSCLSPSSSGFICVLCIETRCDSVGVLPSVAEVLRENPAAGCADFIPQILMAELCCREAASFLHP